MRGKCRRPTWHHNASFGGGRACIAQCLGGYVFGDRGTIRRLLLRLRYQRPGMPPQPLGYDFVQAFRRRGRSRHGNGGWIQRCNGWRSDRFVFGLDRDILREGTASPLTLVRPNAKPRNPPAEIVLPAQLVGTVHNMLPEGGVGLAVESGDEAAEDGAEHLCPRRRLLA